MKVLFVPFMERGHVHPLIGVMQALERAGHEIAVYGQVVESLARQLETAGIHCAWYPAPRAPVAPPSAGKTRLFRNPRYLRRWHELVAVGGLDPEPVDLARRAIRDSAADVVCADPLLRHVGIAAELEDVPWAAIATDMVWAADPAWRYPRADVLRELEPTLLERMRELGARAPRLVQGCAVSPWLNLVFLSEAFAPRAWSGCDYAWYLGPSRPLGTRGDEPPFPWERLRRDVPIVYVSGGGGHAVSFRPEQLGSFARALSEDEAQLVLALQDLIDHPFVRELPPSAVAVRYAPQVALLEQRAAVMITHGGFNTVNECLTHGRPMLVVPIAHEQFVQAHAVERVGAGLSLDLDEVSAERCRPLLHRLVDPREGFQRAIEPIRRSYQVNGALRAAELVSDLARTRTPLPPDLSGS